MQGKLVLEDGRVFEGVGFGASGVKTGEVVFNTSMTGYQEILTDPSYYQQIVTMTVTHIGNTGVNPEDVESARAWVPGFVVRSLSPVVSNWREQGTLDEYLKEQGVIGLTEIATRALVRHIRSKGVMRAAIANGPEAEDTTGLMKLAQNSLDMSGANLVDSVTTPETYHWTERSDPAMVSGSSLRSIWSVGRCIRLWHQAQYPAVTDGPRVARDSGSSTHSGSRGIGNAARRHIFEQWPRRPGGCDLCHRQCGAIGGSGPDVWYLPGAPNSGTGTRRQNRKDAFWASRRQPTGQKSAH